MRAPCGYNGETKSMQGSQVGHGFPVGFPLTVEKPRRKICGPMSSPFPHVTGKELDKWLRQQHKGNVASAINWQQPGGTMLPLAKWSQLQAKRLVDDANV